MKAYILPTGNEILEGIVRDLDAPEIMRQIVAEWPEAEVTRVSPIIDEEDAIFKKICDAAETGADLIVLIGGSGGGHRFSNSLGRDFTHTALVRYLDEYSAREIYGKNGHMWSKLVCGKKHNALFINVPGPFQEAKAAMEACIAKMHEGAGVEDISKAMAQAVFEKYPKGAASFEESGK